MELFEISNKTDIYKGDFDKMCETEELETFTKGQVLGFMKDYNSLIIKGEQNELSGEDKQTIDFAKAEVESLSYPPWNVINDKNQGEIRFTRPIQVDIEKGVYKDTHLNKKLGRVGKEWGGKKDKKYYKKVDGIK